MNYEFPPDFFWGAATSSYQIEGAVDADGRGPSIWDQFSATPGTIEDGSTGAVACDHYRRYEEDLDLMAWMGLRAYRFSIAWPRVLPEGRGRVQEAGLDFYRRLVDGLLERGITPMATLYHWDLPLALHDAGGWPSRDTAYAFAEYAQVVGEALGDRVKHWTTHNEPWCAAFLGYSVGVQAPGHTDEREALAAAHHILLSHGLSVPVLRACSKDAEVGIVNMHVPAYPASESDADAEAAVALDGYFNRWFLDPVFGRGYPVDQRERYVEKGVMDASPAWLHEGDEALLGPATDYYGINYYSRGIARCEKVKGANLPQTVFASDEQTDMGWEVFPDGLQKILTRVHREYAPAKIYITENGAAYADPLDGGRVRDVRRKHYLARHFAAARQAMNDGVPLAGYFVWSLMDNFEWAYGYGKRFGLIHVDYETLERTPKDSAHWYRDLIAQHGFHAEELRG